MHRILAGRVLESFDGTDPEWLAARSQAIGNRSASWRRILARRLLAGGRGKVVTPGALRLAHLLDIARAIEVLRPRRVLKVGCGNGNMLFSLAATFPEVHLFGIELSAAGVDLAHKARALETLEASFAAACYGPVVDATAHRGVAIQAADARALPFPDRGFNRVYTRLALEQ